MKASEPIFTTHNGVVVTYDERDDRWLFTLRGRDRFAQTLTKAREAIDAPVKEAKDKPFERREAWLWRYGHRPASVTVTGTAMQHYGSGCRYWIVNKNGERSKIDAPELFSKTPENDTKVAQIIQLFDKIEELEKQRFGIKLSPFIEG